MHKPCLFTFTHFSKLTTYSLQSTHFLKAHTNIKTTEMFSVGYMFSYIENTFTYTTVYASFVSVRCICKCL